MKAYDHGGIVLHHGSCLDVLRELPDASVDAVVTDPPYGLGNTSPEQVADTIVRWVNGDRDYLPGGAGFMGKSWDAFVPPVAVWDECLRVLKPGGHVLAFAGSRTVDLMTLGLRLAGFDIRDSVAWLYGSGFPKSLDVSKAIDKARTEDLAPAAAVARWLVDQMDERGVTRRNLSDHFETANIAQQWTTHWVDGAVKPRVPTVAQWAELRSWLDLPGDMDAEVWRLNGRKGQPGDNFEAREVLSERVSEVKGGSWAEMAPSGRFKPGEKVIRETAAHTPEAEQWQGWGTALKPAFEPIVVARKPLAGTVAANVLAHGTGALNIDATRIEGEPWKAHTATGLGSVKFFTEGDTSEIEKVPHGGGRWPANVVLDESQAEVLDKQSGTLTSGAWDGKRNRSKFEDQYGEFAGAEESPRLGDTGGASRFFYVAKADQSERVRVDGIAHPTVKPIALMRWLVRLVTPPGGTVLEPFAGSGTTVEACLLEGFRCIAIEREADYLPLIRQRIARRRDPVAAVQGSGEDGGLFDLLNEETA